MKPKILFVDDELQISAMTKEYLTLKGFEVDLIHNSEGGLEEFKKSKYSLCLLDVKMPFKDGFELAIDIRELDQNIPIIFLTGKSETDDRVKGLTLGADDYITKPYSMEELALRINAILKRTNQSGDSSPKDITIGQYAFDPISRELTRDTTTVKLSAIESKLLQLLSENTNNLVKRDYALARIWQDADQLKGRSLNVYVSKLRTYLKEDNRIEILNVHGDGYRLVVK